MIIDETLYEILKLCIFSCKDFALNSCFSVVNFQSKRRWVVLSSQEPTEVQISKLKLRLCRKNQKCILVIAMNPKILYVRFLAAQLNRTLMKKL